MNQDLINVEPAGFFPRLGAYLIDMCVAGVVIGMINLPIGILRMVAGDSVCFKDILFDYDIFQIVNYLLMSAYFIVMTYTTGRTVGKMLMKLRVVSTVGTELTFWQVAFREIIGKYLSGILYIGYLMVGVSEQKLALHDRLADTRVIYNSKAYQNGKKSGVVTGTENSFVQAQTQDAGVDVNKGN